MTYNVRADKYSIHRYKAEGCILLYATSFVGEPWTYTLRRTIEL